jgi:release factor glutamine methyltransferase
MMRGPVVALVRERLRSGAIAEPDADARLLVEHVLGTSLLSIIAEPSVPVSKAEADALNDALAARLAGRPVARIIGHRDFWGLRFALSEATLEPRPDSETVVELALDLIGARRRQPLAVLDLGTGSGCLLLALLHELPMARGVGRDLSGDALVTAKENAKAAGVGIRCDFEQGSWGAGLTGLFDLIVSNPPYIPKDHLGDLAREVIGHDPVLALDGGADGLDAYRALMPALARLLAPDGVAVLEIGAGQRDDVLSLAQGAGLACTDERRDLGGHVRAVAFRRTSR